MPADIFGRGWSFTKKVFGKAPRGMWPSEGSVSQDILEAITDVGIEWIATDEEILAYSTNGWVARDGNGHSKHPEMLYRPWNLEAGKKPAANCVSRPCSQRSGGVSLSAKRSPITPRRI